MPDTPTLSGSKASDILQRTLPTACKLLSDLGNGEVPLTNELTMDAWEAILNAKQDIAYQVESMHSNMEYHDSRRSLISALQNLTDRLEEALNLRLETSSPPRLYRLSKALEFSDKELRAFIFFLFHDNLGGNRERGDKLKDCRAFACMNFSEFYAFATSDRKHMKEGLICAQSEYEENFLSKTVPGAVKKAMFGGSITFDEAMTVSSPTFAAILAEEPDSIYAKNKGLLKLTAMKAEKKKTQDGKAGPPKVKSPPVNPVEVNIDTTRMSELLGSLENGPISAIAAGNIDLDAVDEVFPLQDDRGEGDDDDDDTSAYTNDISYLSDGVQVIISASDLSSKRLGSENSWRFHWRKRNPDSDIHEATIKYQRAHSRFKLRLQKTKVDGNFMPRLERIVEKLGLNHFERLTVITLIANIVSLKVRGHFRDNIHTIRAHHCLLVSSIIGALCDGDLEKEIAVRPNFYKNSRLVSSGLITLHTHSSSDSTDIGEYACVLDRMAFDYIVGLQTELTEIIESARCYTPEVDMETVILPEKMKRLAVQRVENFELFRKLRKEMGFDDIVRYGKGLTLFFHGKSGTGKTLFANALAAHLSKKVLVVDIDAVQKPSDMSESQALRVVFREAQMQNAIVFMDECDALLESRTGGSSSRVAVILREMENFDGIVILATNRPQCLDEAMHRRIALSLEFQDPDAKMRHEIWRRHIPKNMVLKDDVNLMALAIEFELNGGYIKNAVFEALASAVTRVANERKIARKEDKDIPSENLCLEASEVFISMEELRVACHRQSRADMSRTKLQRRIIASSGLDSLIASEEAMSQLKDVVEVEKVHRILSTRWGFREEQARSNCVLIMGPHGCGKTHAAACLGYEVGRPLQTLSMTEILRKGPSAYELSEVFAQAAVAGAVVVIEQGEQLLFEAADLSNNSSQGLELLFNIKSYNGLVIICVTTQSSPSDAGWSSHTPIPNRVATLLSYLIKLTNPNREERLRLWKQLIPESTPKAKDVGPSLEKIAAKYDTTGARILACIMRAASAAARRASKVSGSVDPESSGLLTGKDLEESCEAEVGLVEATNSAAAWVRALYV